MMIIGNTVVTSHARVFAVPASIFMAVSVKGFSSISGTTRSVLMTRIAPRTILLFPNADVINSSTAKSVEEESSTYLYFLALSTYVA